MTVVKKSEFKRVDSPEGASPQAKGAPNSFVETAAFFEKWSAGAGDWFGMLAKPGQVPDQGDFTRLGREAMEAWLAAGAVVARGIQDLNQTWFAVAREMVDDGAACAKDLLGCTGLPEALEVQTKAIQASYEKLVAEGQKASTASAKMAEEAWAPLSQYVSKSVAPAPRPAGR